MPVCVCVCVCLCVCVCVGWLVGLVGRSVGWFGLVGRSLACLLASSSCGLVCVVCVCVCV